jgi:hypothetical protein
MLYLLIFTNELKLHPHWTKGYIVFYSFFQPLKNHVLLVIFYDSGRIPLDFGHHFTLV